MSRRSRFVGLPFSSYTNAAGAMRWPAAGIALCTATGNQVLQVAAPDAAGGAYVAWRDLRNGLDADVYVQRVNKAAANSRGTSLTRGASRH